VAIYVVLLRLLSGVSMPWSDLRQAALVGAIGAGVLKIAVSYGVVGGSTNPVLASFAIIIGLLVVINLLSRVTLLAAAWAAVGRGRPTSAPPRRPSPPRAGCRTRGRWSRRSASVRGPYGDRGRRGHGCGGGGRVGLCAEHRGLVSGLRHRS